MLEGTPGFPLVLDFDRLMAACRPYTDKKALFEWFTRNGRRYLAKAGVIRSSMCLDHPRGMRSNFSIKGLWSAVDWSGIMRDYEFPMLQELTLTSNATMVALLHFPIAIALRKLTLIGVSIKPGELTNSPMGLRMTCFRTSRAWGSEAFHDQDQIMDALRTLPNLADLTLDGIHCLGAATSITNPVACPALKTVVICCANNNCIPDLRRALTAEDAMWRVVTRDHGNIPEWGWDLSGLGDDDLRLIVENSSNAVWLTVTSTKSPDPLTPVYNQGFSNPEFTQHRWNRPNRHVRKGAISVCYREEAGLIDSPFSIVGNRIKELYVYEMSVKKDGCSIWEMPNLSWGFATGLKISTLRVFDERALSSGLAAKLPCPKEITCVCRTSWSGISVVDSLSVELASWAGRDDGNPKTINFVGCKRWWDDAIIRQLRAQRGDAVRDLRIVNGEISVKPQDRLSAEIVLAERTLRHAKVSYPLMHLLRSPLTTCRWSLQRKSGRSSRTTPTCHNFATRSPISLDLNNLAHRLHVLYIHGSRHRFLYRTIGLVYFNLYYLLGFIYDSFLDNST